VREGQMVVIVATIRALITANPICECSSLKSNHACISLEASAQIRSVAIFFHAVLSSFTHQSVPLNPSIGCALLFCSNLHLLIVVVNLTEAVIKHLIDDLSLDLRRCLLLGDPSRLDTYNQHISTISLKQRYNTCRPWSDSLLPSWSSDVQG
jgi:hypothetical protein